MKKAKGLKKVSPEQALKFLEDFRLMQAGLDEPTQPISIRVPANILRAFKAIAQAEKRPYQSLMILAFRDYLQKMKTKNDASA